LFVFALVLCCAIECATQGTSGNYPKQWLSGMDNYNIVDPFLPWVQQESSSLCVDSPTTVTGDMTFSVKGTPVSGSATFVIDATKCTSSITQVDTGKLNISPVIGGVQVTVCPAWTGVRVANGVKVSFSFTYGSNEKLFEGTASTSDTFELRLCAKLGVNIVGSSSFPQVCLNEVDVTDVTNTCALSAFEIHPTGLTGNICVSKDACPAGVDCPALCQGVVGDLCTVAQTLGQGLDHDAYPDVPYCLTAPSSHHK